MTKSLEKNEKARKNVVNFQFDHWDCPTKKHPRKKSNGSFFILTYLNPQSSSQSKWAFYSCRSLTFLYYPWKVETTCSVLQSMKTNSSLSLCLFHPENRPVSNTGHQITGFLFLFSGGLFTFFLFVGEPRSTTTVWTGAALFNEIDCFVSNHASWRCNGRHSRREFAR